MRVVEESQGPASWWFWSNKNVLICFYKGGLAWSLWKLVLCKDAEKACYTELASLKFCSVLFEVEERLLKMKCIILDKDKTIIEASAYFL